MIGHAGRFGGRAIAPQIRGHDRKALGQRRRNLVPKGVSLGIAVQEQKRGTLTALHTVNPRTVPIDLERREIIEHPLLLSHCGAQVHA